MSLYIFYLWVIANFVYPLLFILLEITTSTAGIDFSFLELENVGIYLLFVIASLVVSSPIAFLYRHFLEALLKRYDSAATAFYWWLVLAPGLVLGVAALWDFFVISELATVIMMLAPCSAMIIVIFIRFRHFFRLHAFLHDENCLENDELLGDIEEHGGRDEMHAEYIEANS